MKVLLDANIVIAIEGDTNRQHVNAEAAASLHRLILAADGAPCIIENVRDDFVRTADTQLRARRLREISKYLTLARLSIRPDFAEKARYSWPLNPNDKVDAAHLLAVERNAVTWLVTEDRGIHRRAQHLGLADRVMSIADAIASLKALLFEPIEHYAVESVSPHQFDLSDQIFDSLRIGYPSFDAWWQNKVVAENRHCLVLGSIDRVTGFAVLKADSPDVGTLPGRALKICTFKISDSAVGAKRGELLLGTVIEHARSNSYDSCFVEVQEHHGPLIALFQEFGFYRLGEKSPGEHVFGKILTPHLDEEHCADPLEYNRRYGPGAMLVDRAYLVPVIPAWHGMLFPSTSSQPSLFDQTYGNAVRKVYLCHSNIKKLNPGDALFFLRTRSEQAVHAVGVLEATLRTTEADQILAFAGTRTVFSRDEIEKMCDRPVLAIRFRLNAILERPISVEELRELGVVKRSPQSIAELRSERGKSWAHRRGRVALMSIRPEFAQAIIEGRKKVEFRKRPVAPDVSHVLIYATMPVGALVGWFAVDGQYTTEPENLWKRFREDGAISRTRFFEYYSSGSLGTGIRVGSVVRFESPLLLSWLDGVSRPPQSFQYLSEQQASEFFDSCVAEELVTA